jgi:DNA-binding CsgD family transcriptional regulator
MVEPILESEYVAESKLLDVNLANDDRPTLLFVIEGDRERFAAALDAIPEILDHDLTPIDSGRFYAYLRPETNPAIRDLLSTLTRDGLVISLPVVYRDGSVRVELVGTANVLQNAIDDLPAGIRVHVTQVGEYDTDRESVASALSDRQREAVETGLSLGYYEIPRQATHEDIAERMDCAPNTASEHLQKAEAKIVAAVMG